MSAPNPPFMAHRPAPKQIAEQAAARAAVHLERYLRDDRRAGERAELEKARKAIDEALEAAA